MVVSLSRSRFKNSFASTNSSGRPELQSVSVLCVACSVPFVRGKDSETVKDWM